VILQVSSNGQDQASKDEDAGNIEGHKNFEQARKAHYCMKAAMAKKFDSEEDEEDDV